MAFSLSQWGKTAFLIAADKSISCFVKWRVTIPLIGVGTCGGSGNTHNKKGESGNENRFWM